MHGLELQNGDPSEWRAAFSAHSGPVLGFLRRRVPPEEAEDLLQETFLRVMRSGPPERIENLRSYLLATAKHLSLNRLRRPRPVEAPAGAASGDLDGLPATRPGPHEEASFRFLSDALSRALVDLPSAHRRAFELAALDGFSYEEVARATGTTLAQVKVHVYRARRRLVDALAPYRGGSPT
jgi:RNA polymerase sigma-70 factor (ECF subfamily)